jgi:methionine synthase I (cobalamin-dependent)
MPYTNIDVTLSDADVQAVKDAFATVKQKLPFMINLTVDERRSTVKTGPDSLSFVENALTASQANPTIFPASFGTQAFKNDVDLFATLTELNILAASIASQIDDTRMAVGGEAMQGAIQVYNYVKAAAKTTPGLKPVADQLGERFARASKQKEPAKPDK